MQPLPAFLRACRLDVEVRKPGNVSVASPGHGMTAGQFIAAAEAAAPPLFEPGAAVGARVERAVQASLAAAGCNANLGIVLLAAPVAAALEQPGASRSEPALREAIAQVLGALDLDDAGAAFRAIATANPGGLGRADEQDVAHAPTVTLLDAMRLAAGRDRIARQYAHGYAELHAIGLPAWRRGLGKARDSSRAMLLTYIDWLATAPDSHIVRKHGAAAAHKVLDEAARWCADRAAAPPDAPIDAAAIAAWDERLKAGDLNPGTSADLCVLTAFVAACLDDGAHACQRGSVLA